MVPQGVSGSSSCLVHGILTIIPDETTNLGRYHHKGYEITPKGNNTLRWFVEVRSGSKTGNPPKRTDWGRFCIPTLVKHGEQSSPLREHSKMHSTHVKAFTVPVVAHEFRTILNAGIRIKNRASNHQKDLVGDANGDSWKTSDSISIGNFVLLPGQQPLRTLLAERSHNFLHYCDHFLDEAVRIPMPSSGGSGNCGSVILSSCSSFVRVPPTSASEACSELSGLSREDEAPSGTTNGGLSFGSSTLQAKPLNLAGSKRTRVSVRHSTVDE
ncbi:hypothetical protein T265_07562 [Opisthorchis viverrini]|uniref:Uncharacterized protein n=1 Tax=Opisthorchis viverrini TaxID=6198 RepID=A0A074ZCK0_OPIVI|nr:hypothetical protein T265_07562 [Opisthorchis viverrini]KER24888.1 hypothetical protein T265_07562 [Opisthorchis viverrini]